MEAWALLANANVVYHVYSQVCYSKLNWIFSMFCDTGSTVNTRTNRVTIQSSLFSSPVMTLKFARYFICEFFAGNMSLKGKGWKLSHYIISPILMGSFVVHKIFQELKWSRWGLLGMFGDVLECKKAGIEHKMAPYSLSNVTWVSRNPRMPQWFKNNSFTPF